MEPFKNKINEEVAIQMAQAIMRNYPEFNQAFFLKNIKFNLRSLELKERVIFLAQKLNETLPTSQKESLLILQGAIKQNEGDIIGLSGFAIWPLTEFISAYCLEEFDQAMEVLKEMTKVFTSEFAVRKFLLFNEKKALWHFRKWVNDENEHVRRLVSEGLRPLLPWGQKLPSFAKNPLITWDLLEILKHDSSAYVRKSVANHINDHSKNHPDLVVQKLMEWKKSSFKNKEIDWIIRHASRTLIKNGHGDVFKLHGVDREAIKFISQKILTKTISIGSVLQVEVSFQNIKNREEKVILDHELQLLRSNGKYGLKCFKGKVLKLSPLEKKKILLKIPLKEVTTRRYYSGRQYWNIKVNGLSAKRLNFVLNT